VRADHDHDVVTGYCHGIGDHDMQRRPPADGRQLFRLTEAGRRAGCKDDDVGHHDAPIVLGRTTS